MLTNIMKKPLENAFQEHDLIGLKQLCCTNNYWYKVHLFLI